MNKITFQRPHHQSPENIAYSFTYNPYVSIKIDGIFHTVKLYDKKKYFPIFPYHWVQIEGEYYEFENGDKILYIFYVQSNKKKLNTLELISNEIESTFIKLTKFNKKIASNKIEAQLYYNIKKSIEWLNINKKNKSLLWFPKKYCKLDTVIWNKYILQLDSVFRFSQSKLLSDLIKQDGIVVTPNISKPKNTIIKIKPKKEMTIDLMFNGKTFVSGDNTDYKDIIEEKNISKYKIGLTYRLGPSKNGKFIVYAEREKWKKPNSDVHVIEILYKFKNFFEIKQLLNIYMNPWYGAMNKTQINKVLPLFKFSQSIYNQILSKLNTGIILDIGCGSMGQYYKTLLNPKLKQYIGMDIDLVKLNEAKINTNFSGMFKFLLFNYGYSWERQNDYFPNNLWNTYYKNLVNYNILFDNIISVFAVQYANQSSESWETFVDAVDKRSKKGTKIFFIWVDSDKIEENTEYYKLSPNKKEITISLPHRDTHKEPTLGYKQICESFGKKWTRDIQLENTITYDNLNNSVSIYKYIKVINWVVFIKK
jgi:hypothetical protein